MPVSKLLRFSKDRWAVECAKQVQAAIEIRLSEMGYCSIMLTGGRAGRALYEAWRNLPGFTQLENVDFFWGDERCVPPDAAESNYKMALEALFSGNPSPKGKQLFRMEAESVDLDEACLRYERLLPERIDVILLGVGEDGHVASLFPGSTALLEKSRRVVPITSPKRPFRRFTITPSVIRSAGQVFVLAPGPEKAAIQARLTETEVTPIKIPALLVASGFWVLDNQEIEG